MGEFQPDIEKIINADFKELEQITHNLSKEELDKVMGCISLEKGYKLGALNCLRAMKICQIKRNAQTTLDEVIKNPGRYSKRGFWDWQDEFTLFIESRVRNDGRAKRIAKKLGYVAGAMASFGISALPHELIHAGVNTLTGGVNKEIVLNKFYGGSLWAQIIPSVQAKWLIPFIGGYVDMEPAGKAEYITTAVAPYCMTPLGIMLFYSGLKRKNPYLLSVGAGLTCAHISGVLGDFWLTGRQLITGAVDMTYNFFGYNSPDYDKINFIAAAGIAIGGFYIGNRIMSYSYNLMKGGYNSLKNKFFSKAK